MVSGTPFRLYKTNTHQGGHQVPFIVHWPDGIADVGTIRDQYQHVTDLLPTLAEMAGLEVPTSKNGIEIPVPAGTSFVSSVSDAETDSSHREQYFEMIGHRGFYRDGWSATTFHPPRTAFSDDRWELHNLADDPTETVDLARINPEKLEELRAAWEEAAWSNQVYPLDEGNSLKHLLRPPWDDDLVVETTLYRDMPTLERVRSTALIGMRSFDVRIRIDHAAGDQGVLVAHGDQGGGYAIYIEHDHIHYVHNGYGDMTVVDCGPIEPGAREVTLAIESPGEIVWNARVFVDGHPVGEAPGLVMLMAIAPFQGIDVGIDRRSPVSWDLHERHGTFPYTGSIQDVTYTPGESAPDAGSRWIDYLRQAGTRYE
jgi:arylsulfatase